MATIREYFEFDPTDMTLGTEWTIAPSDGPIDAASTIVIPRIAYDVTANAKYWYIFISSTSSPESILALLLNTPYFLDGSIHPQGDGVFAELGLIGYSERGNTDTLIFTRRVHFYVDSELAPQEREFLVQMALQKDIYLIVKDREYARKRSEAERPVAFIAHDTRDKDAIVRELAKGLLGLSCPVWYDEFSLKVGDNLRQAVEKGLKEAKKCIMIISPHFISNEGWARAEVDSLITREFVEKDNVILPVWHEVSRDDVYNYSPILANKVALPSSLGVDELAHRLVNVIRR